MRRSFLFLVTASRMRPCACARLQTTVRTQSREAVSQAQSRIREAVTRNKKEKLTALLHHISVDALRWAFLNLRKEAAPGIDRLTWDNYAEYLEDNLADLHDRILRGAYRALPSRRRFIPKPDGRQRPLGIAALEDKIVQGAVVAILTPIYEAEFLGFSYGFRPGRSQHDALDALGYGMQPDFRGGREQVRRDHVETVVLLRS